MNTIIRLIGEEKISCSSVGLNLREDINMSNFGTIEIKNGSGGFGGPLTVTPTEEKINFYISQVVELNQI